MTGRTARVDRQIWSTTATLVVTEPRALTMAVRLLDRDLTAVERACSRFTPTSELADVLRRPDRLHTLSPVLNELVGAALRVDRATDGLVDPTVAAAVIALGYDRDLGALAGRDPELGAARPAPGTGGIRHDPVAGTLRVPTGVGLDLGATAKAWAADRAAARIAEAAGCGVLVGIGGDIAVAGPAPIDGWRIAIADDHRTAEQYTRQRVTIRAGGLASSSTTARRWSTSAGQRHHIVDPRTGSNPPPGWRTVSAVAGSAVDANAAATAAIVLGAAAPDWLAHRGMAARLVGVDDAVLSVAGWPTDVIEAA